jgi:AraC-like DNA-binding protein
VITVGDAVRLLTPATGDELRLASILALARSWTGIHIVPVEVRLSTRRPACVDAHERFFGCPLRFDQQESALVLAPEIAQRPLDTADPALAAYLDALAGVDPNDDLRQAVLDAIRSGEVTLHWVARRLSVSTRTLQRRLQDGHTSFRELVDDVRASEAARMLARGDRVTTIAERLGFAEERSFRRAFARWRERSGLLARPVLAPGRAGT